MTTVDRSKASDQRESEGESESKSEIDPDTLTIGESDNGDERP